MNPSPPPITALEELLRTVLAYDTETSTYVRLVPTEGIMSPLQKLMYLSVQNERYLHAPPEDDEKAVRYPDIGRLQQIYAICRSAICRAFDARYAVPDLLSGLQAMTVTILAFSSIGDTVASVDPSDGGHPLTAEVARMLGRRSQFLAYDLAERVVSPAKASGEAGTGRPALVYLDQSNALYASDVGALRLAFPDAALVVDVSHTAALVVGHLFPNPLDESATAIVGSTHKSLNGPQKAFFATRDPAAFDRLRTTAKTFVSNNHPASVAALAVCLLEAERFGDTYAARLVGNARVLASALTTSGVPVVARARYSELVDTHQLWIDCGQLGWEAESAVAELKDAGIVVNTLYIRTSERKGRKGLRLGTTEVTRLGMGAPEMQAIAEAIASVLVARTDLPRAAPAMAELRGKWTKPRYCYDLADLAPALRDGLAGLLWFISISAAAEGGRAPMP